MTLSHSECPCAATGAFLNKVIIMYLDPISLVDYFMEFGPFQPVLLSFVALGISLLLQKLIFGGVDI